MNRFRWPRKHISQRKKRSSLKRIKLFVYIADICIAGFVIFCLLHVFFLITLHPRNLGSKVLSWDGHGALHLLVAGIDKKMVLSSISLLAIDSGGATSVALPASVYLNNSIDGIQLQSVYAVNALQDQSTAINQMQRQLEESIHTRIDGYLFIESDDIQRARTYFDMANDTPSTHVDALTIFMQSPQIRGLVNNSLFTNLSVKGLLSLIHIISETTQVTRIYLKGDDIQAFASGTYLDTTYISKDISSRLFDSTLQTEHARISIYNATMLDGEGNFLAMLLQNEGGLVDYVGNIDNKGTQTYIYCSDPNQFPYTIQVLQRMLQGKIVPKLYTSTSDIAIVLSSPVS